MAIFVSSQFRELSALPIEEKMVVVDLTARDAIPAGERYEGLFTYVVSEQRTYQLRGGITNSDWVIGEGDVYYTQDFVIGDWVLNDDVYELEVEHNIGRSVNVIVYESDNVVQMHNVIKVGNNSLILQVTSEPDLRFEGTVLIN